MENVKLSLNGFRLDGELKNIPIGFVNGIRRILLAEIPTVTLGHVEIVENNTHLTHEMLRHRIEMLPINVRPDETGVIRDTKIELRMSTAEDGYDVTTDDFVVSGPRKNVMLYDRDLDEPMLFMTMKPNQIVHIRASLLIETKGASQVCVSTFKNHIDPKQAETDRAIFIENGGDQRVFDNFLIQRSYARDDNGRPYWFDLTVESIGVTKASELVKKAVEVLQAKITEWAKTPVLREENGWYRMETEGETFTVGQLIQELMYAGGLVEFVSRDVGHPLVPLLTIRFNTKTVQPDAVVERAKQEALALCESVLQSV
jgi:DNA-directed RNA polymerase subunit L